MDIFFDFLHHCIESKNNRLTGLIVADNPHFFQNSDLISSFSEIKTIKFDEIYTILGISVDILFVDLRKYFIPNKISILFETVRGGGSIFILGLPDPKWRYSVNKKNFLPEKVSIPDDISSSSILLNWFLKNLIINPQCRTDSINSSEVIASFNPMPYNINLTTQIDNILVTKDQHNIIENLLATLLDSEHPDSCSILVANRGRGKSASVGLSIAHALSKKGVRNVIISSPHPANIQTLFEFLMKGLTSKNVKFQVRNHEGWTSEIRTSSRARISYLWPSEIEISLKADIIVFDEAAAIPVEILKKVLKIKAKKIFVSTVHGYEGAGKSFQFKFLSYLQTQKLIHYQELSLDQPIRYLQFDLIEKLLNDAFFLDVELDPPLIKQRTLIKDSIILQEWNDPQYLFSEKGLPNLKQLFGLLVYAHYRNQPNDLLLLADSGKHFLIGIYGNDNKNNKLLLVSNQLAREGEMSDQEILRVTSGEFIKGNLIPNIAIRHFSENFAKLRGLRIIRIATHPSLLNKGYGRLALELQNPIFSTYDWVGVSYGATVKLMKFWRKFGFKSVHIRPIKTAETGEWNIVLIRPISHSAASIINPVSADFLLQFIALLKQSLHSMSPELTSQILKSCSSLSNYKVRITSSGKIRLKNYLKGNLNFLLAVDVIYELAKAYFVTPTSIKLSSSQELLLISRVLQGRTWGQTLGRTGLNWKAANALLEKAVAKIAQIFMKNGSEDF